jgi:small subunit ribosomal protein S8
MNYLVADLIVRIKNAASANRREVSLPYSKLSKAISDVLVKEGFLKEVKVVEEDGKKSIQVVVAYKKRIPVLTSISIVSKPSLRVYITAGDLSKARGYNTKILSTNRGVMTGKEAQKEGVGGELLFEIQ